MKTPPIFSFSLFFASLRCAACVEVGRQGVLARVRETFESLRVSVNRPPIRVGAGTLKRPMTRGSNQALPFLSRCAAARATLRDRPR